MKAENYLIQVYKAFEHNEVSVQAVDKIATSLNDIYRYFEPSFFQGDFFVIKDFADKIVLDESKGIQIQFEKNILLNKTTGTLIIQVFEDVKLFLWENEKPDALFNKSDCLIYHFSHNIEKLYAYKEVIDITITPIGSRYATQFSELKNALNTYGQKRIYHSSCPHFKNSWFDNNRIFFKGGGKNIPEKFMQESLYEFLSTYLTLRGISIEVLREFNVDSDKPKPVDIRIHWREANRVALIEIKWMGTVRKDDGTISYSHGNPRANSGIAQVKGYFDSAHEDMPTTIIKSYLVVIDGRRNNLTDAATTISYADGMHYKDVDIDIDDDKKFHESIPGIEKPIKMFAAPICS